MYGTYTYQLNALIQWVIYQLQDFVDILLKLFEIKHLVSTKKR